jgi:hypothetical protein
MTLSKTDLAPIMGRLDKWAEPDRSCFSPQQYHCTTKKKKVDPGCSWGSLLWRWFLAACQINTCLKSLNLSLACVSKRHEMCKGSSRKECECSCHFTYRYIKWSHVAMRIVDSAYTAYCDSITSNCSVRKTKSNLDDPLYAHYNNPVQNIR